MAVHQLKIGRGRVMQQDNDPKRQSNSTTERLQNRGQKSTRDIDTGHPENMVDLNIWSVTDVSEILLLLTNYALSGNLEITVSLASKSLQHVHQQLTNIVSLLLGAEQVVCRR